MRKTRKNKIDSKFLRIICPRCRNIQIVYGKSTLKIKCNECNYFLIRTTGGKVKVKAQIKEILAR